MAFVFNKNKRFNTYLQHCEGWYNFTIGFKTETGSVDRAISFKGGRVFVHKTTPEAAEVILRFSTNKTLWEMLLITPNEMLSLILNNKMILDGNIAYLQLFNYYVSLLLGKVHGKMLTVKNKKYIKDKKQLKGHANTDYSSRMKERSRNPLKAGSIDRNVKYLNDPYLGEYTLADFPRLERMLEKHFTAKPVVCIERPRLLTEWFREHGFETDKEEHCWIPVLRQAMAFKHLMDKKKPVIAEGSILAGTTTSKEPAGVLLYPDAHAGMLWGELNSLEHRTLNPYSISPEDALTLHRDIFPFWIHRNFKEYVRSNNDYPLCMKIEERWVYYFVWKSVGISHTIPDYPSILGRGTTGIIKEIDERLGSLDRKTDMDKINSLTAMKITLEGLNIYASNLAGEARRRAALEDDTSRRDELVEIADICDRVPRNPAATLHEAFQVIWIVWIALHMENTNTGLSMGRLDQWLNPYFINDMQEISSGEKRQSYIKKAIELTGCLLMRGTDHLPTVPDIGNYLFGGSSSDQAVTLGGITPGGDDGVNDMTYIFLKATEMLSIRDPNINARFHPGTNSDTYLKRLCEVNYTTAATPSMHNDSAVFLSLADKGYEERHIHDWSATGCVEPTLSGRHMGHTGSILMNMVSALEMALNNGRHPHMNQQFGPETGDIEKDQFPDFEDFFRAFTEQQRFLIDQSVMLNNLLAQAHAVLRPTPFLSSLIDGAIENGIDVTRGGARYNSSGTSNIGLADVTDSMMVIKKLIYDEKAVSFRELKKAIDSDFSRNPALMSIVRRKVPLFGSGDREAMEMAQRIASFIHEAWSTHTNFRGGPYTAGFWSMSQHVAYGTLSGTLPSGRLDGRAFTPGLTPQPGASKNFLDNIHDVAQLIPGSMDNNIAFNVKLSPDVRDTREEIVNAMHSYVRTYFDLGGMQMQFNVINSDTLRDAMANPEKYQNLLVRISGYNAYFVTLNREMQMELIERTEFGL
jgi:formate C-acetyltransferase